MPFQGLLLFFRTLSRAPIVFIFASHLAKSQPACQFPWLPSTGPACATSELQGKLCPQVSFDQKVTFQGTLDSLQCYQGGSPVFTRLSPVSGAVTVGDCVIGQAGETELKEWGASGIICTATFNAVRSTAQPCSQLNFTLVNPIRFDTPVTWTPSDCIATVQGYEKDGMVGQVREIKSGEATVGQVATRSTPDLILKVWPSGASVPSETRSLVVDDCRSPNLTVSSMPTLNTRLTWVPGGVAGKCEASIEAVQDGVSLGRIDALKSGEKTLGDITKNSLNLTDMRMYSPNVATPVETRRLEPVSATPPLLTSFRDDFELDKGWRDFITEEIPDANCYNTGVGSVNLATDIKLSGSRSLRLEPNQKNLKYSNHLIAGNRLLDAGQTGRWSYRFRFYLPSTTATSGEAGPEVSIQNTIGKTQTFIAGLQFQSNPQNPADRINAWAVWMPGAKDDSGKAIGPWVVVANQALLRNQWYTGELVADFNSMEYVRFSVIGAGLNFIKDLSGMPIVAENRGFDPAFVLTVEAENQSTCKNPTVTRNTVYYDDVEITGLPSISPNGVVNGASFLPGTAPGAWISIRGTSLSPATRTWTSADFSGVKLPIQLDGVGVMINGNPAYVYYISPEQLNVLAPEDVALGSVAIQVITSTEKSNTVRANQSRIAPALFTFSQRDGRYVAAVRSDGTYIAPPNLISGLPAVPAKPGDTILLYGTGFGATTPASKIGELSLPADLADDVTVRIGGITAERQYAGLVSPGLYQFNVVVPNLADGEHGVSILIGGVSSQPGVFLVVQR
jgi:uncharacterized protein (TIGR03437 family)